MINNGTLTINNSNSEKALKKGDIKKSYFGEWDDSASISKDHITVEYDYVAKVMDGKELSSLRRRNSLCCKEGWLLLFFLLGAVVLGGGEINTKIYKCVDIIQGT